MPLKDLQVLNSYKRDTYGFTVRPQYLHRFQEYSDIYKEEEEERVQKWKSFLDIVKPIDSDITNRPSEVAQISGERGDSTEQPHVEEASGECDESSEKRLVSDTEEESVSTREDSSTRHKKSCELRTWAEICPSLNSIECMMSIRVKKRKTMKDEKIIPTCKDLGGQVDETGFLGEESEDDIFYENEITDDVNNKLSQEHLFPKEELEFLVHGGIPKDLRGEVWQAFVGVRTRRVERYYNDLLATEIDAGDSKEHEDLLSGNDRTQWKRNRSDVPEKWKNQIEKDLPRTFPGHPALSENGRNSLRHVLLAYARHNPSVGYCQAMNFFAGLFLLMMPEENAFWTLVGLIDDYFEDYFSQEMIESQVDQLVFEDLMHERFPKLVNHLDYLGVEVAWISGPWFLSIFVNMLPWESVLRVWDVLLFEGNRVMLFRTALALMDLYGPAVVTTKDAGDAISLLQTLASSQLVLTACMGFLTITEDRLQELREKHRPAILAAAEESAKGAQVSKDPKGLATKLYSFKHGPESVLPGTKIEAVSSDKKGAGKITSLESHFVGVEEILKGMSIDSEVDSAPDLQEQAEMHTLLEDKSSSVLRAEELEAAFMELVKQDNRRELSAKVERLEQEISELRQALSDKKEGEKAMLLVLMKVEQEQRVTEDARRFVEQEVVAQEYAVHVLQEKYESAMASLAQMEKRVVMAETMLEATLQYESGQSKASSSPEPGHVESPQDIPSRRTSLLSFGMGWRERNKGKLSNESKIEEKGSDNTSHTDDQTNGTGRS